MTTRNFDTLNHAGSTGSITRRLARAYRLCAIVTSLVVACSALTARSVSAAIDPTDVVVLYNTASADGLDIANYYAQVHPGVQLLGLNGVSTAEEITEDHYLNTIRPQVLAGISSTTQVIVTTKGLPLRIRNTVSNPGTYPGWRGDSIGITLPPNWWKPYSSLESELTRVDLISSAEQMGDQAFILTSPVVPFNTPHQAANPYYNSQQAFDRADPDNEGIRLTARLDGFTVSDVKAGIDRAQRAFIAMGHHTFVVDDDPGVPAASADLMPDLVNNVITPSGHAMVFDQTTANITNAPGPVIGYVSHGSHAAGAGFIGNFNFDIAPGAVFHTWESFNAYSFTQGNNVGGQSLIAEWLANGGTAAVGHVEEPTAGSTSVTNEDILFEMLLAGNSFVESAWAATLQLSFVNTVMGDPLMTLRPWTPGDFDLDADVDIDDLNILLANWGNSVGNNSTTTGDTTLNGFITQDDLNALLTQNLGAGTIADVLLGLGVNPPAGLGAPGNDDDSQALPEPGTAAILSIGAWVLWYRRAA